MFFDNLGGDGCVIKDIQIFLKIYFSKFSEKMMWQKIIFKKGGMFFSIKYTPLIINNETTFYFEENL